jgi:hypothetical protein
VQPAVLVGRLARPSYEKGWFLKDLAISFKFQPFVELLTTRQNSTYQEVYTY